MDEITRALSSPVWWLTSAVMAFGMSLLANFASPSVARLLSATSRTVRRHSERRQQKDHAVVQYLLGSEFRQTRLWLHTLYGELLTIKLLLFCLAATALVFVLAQNATWTAAHPTAVRVLSAVGILLVALLYWGQASAFRNFELLREAWRQARHQDLTSAPSEDQ